ncbi:hypothetical protein KP509_33G049300 [Ceratopteris richardii]|uniref:Deoxynucleoside kinase domain-containing protein n=1 Tax=Ceratopteris richardii TaxID=49495 RepID=A0A8T2QQV2_CERRI|nr:hypothetical protein KP509_33G049300 [Ceratopteris richardii]
MQLFLRPLRRLTLRSSMSPPATSFHASSSYSPNSCAAGFDSRTSSRSERWTISLQRGSYATCQRLLGPESEITRAQPSYRKSSRKHIAELEVSVIGYVKRSSKVFVGERFPKGVNIVGDVACTYTQRCFCHGIGDSAVNSHVEAQMESEDKIDDVGTPEVQMERQETPKLSSTENQSDCKDENYVARKVIRSATEKRRSLFGRHSQGKIPDLLTIPGIGPRNLEKLLAKGIGGVAELKQLYLDKFHRGGKDKMIEYLQSSVGIIHKHHAMSITTYIKDTVERELKAEESSLDVTTKRRLTFCVEGNISVGKTTFLHRVTNEAIELRDLVEIVPEPVAKWQDVGPEHFNILDAFYAEPQRYAYTFQNYVFITRLMQEQESAGGLKPLRLMERSVFSDRMVFVRAVHEAKWMNEMEISIYDSWFNPVISVLPGLVPDGFIYLRASPDTCHKRMQMRKRPEEQSVTLDYLRGLHEKHEQWLFPSSSNNEGIFSVSRPSELAEPLPPMLQDRVFYLEGDHVHSSLQKVPALILDCEANIDFTRDFEAKALYAKQVAEFFEYVKRTKEAQPLPGKDMVSRGLVLPGSNGLFMPDSSMLNAQTLKSLHLKQQSSLWK